MKQVIVTTSWDDGHKLDVRLADLLEKYNLKGTFYVSPKDREFVRSDLLTDTQIKQIDKSFEIGAHTMTHPRLTQISAQEALEEITSSKKFLEELLHKKVTSFCYPGGNYTNEHVQMVKDSGFSYARTVTRHVYDLKGSLFEAATTVNAYNHFQDIWKIAKFAKFNPVRTIRYFQWDNLAKAMFDHVIVHGGVYHLWGHSWEIDQHGDWEKLESVLSYIAQRSEVSYKTNAELVDCQPKRLLMAAPYFPPHLGGVEFYTYYLAKYLEGDFGWYTCVVTTGKQGFKVSRTEYQGVRVYYLPYWFKVSNTPINPLWSHWLKQIMQAEDIYIVDAHAPVPVFADLIARITKHIPIVITYHMMSMAKGKSRPDTIIHMYERYILPTTLKRAVQIICSSDKVRNVFLASYRHKSITVTPGVDATLFKPAAHLAKDTILFVGSLNKSDQHKGVHYLLSAFQTISSKHPNAKLIIVGGGTGKADFEAEARSLQISDQVQFVGEKLDSSMQAMYQKASIFVLPTLNDSYPLVILEAMASGLPVVSTKVGGIPTQVDDQETGYLVAPGDSEALAEKIVYLLDHPEVAAEFGNAGRAKVIEKLTWQSRAFKTDETLEAAMQRYTGRRS